MRVAITSSITRIMTKPKRSPMQVFIDEDEPMIEAAQEALGEAEFWDARPAILKTDAAAIRCRRALMEMRRREAGEAAP